MEDKQVTRCDFTLNGERCTWTSGHGGTVHHVYDPKRLAHCEVHEGGCGCSMCKAARAAQQRREQMGPARTVTVELKIVPNMTNEDLVEMLDRLAPIEEIKIL